jgi:hypothetical protein
VYDQLVAERLSNQCLLGPRHRTAVAVVEWFGAVQAQEYGPAKWALGLRLPEGSTERRIERALTTGSILRTHVLRPTWHFVAAPDIRWMLDLTGPRVHRAMASYRRQLGLDARAFARATSVFERVLQKNALTRPELREELARRGVKATAAQMGHLCMYAELEAVICSGPRRGKHATYALVEERAPRARRLRSDEAIAELVKRYFRSHGPATTADFAWWSGLTVGDAKRGLEINRGRRQSIDGLDYWTLGARPRFSSARGTTHLLPIYDEYVVAYRDRVAVPHVPMTRRSDDGSPVTFQHAIVVAGQVAGTWRLTPAGSTTKVSLYPGRSLTRDERAGLNERLEQYERFRGGLATPE